MLIGIPKHKHSSIHHYSYVLICVIPELSVVFPRWHCYCLSSSGCDSSSIKGCGSIKSNRGSG